jgi:hypothetical protein
VQTEVKGMYEKLAEGRRPAPEHPLDPIISFRPNRRQNDFEFWRQVCYHLVLRQNAYVQIVQGPKGKGWVGELVPLNPDRVHGSILFAPTLWYDGWATPWYRFVLRLCMLSRFGRFCISRLYSFVETEPYGIKDPTIRGVVLAAMNSGDTTQAGIMVTPGASVCELCLLVDQVTPGAARGAEYSYSHVIPPLPSQTAG